MPYHHVVGAEGRGGAMGWTALTRAAHPHTGRDMCTGGGAVQIAAQVSDIVDQALQPAINGEESLTVSL